MFIFGFSVKKFCFQARETDGSCSLKNDEMVVLLREQLKEAEQELQSVRNSLRYRIGDIALQAVPLSWRSLRLLPRLWELYRSMRSGVGRGGGVVSSQLAIDESALRSADLSLGKGLESKLGRWITDDAELMAQRLFMGAPVSSLTLRTLSVPVARQLGRLHQGGTKIIWWPDPEVDHPPELVSYVAPLFDKCRLEERI